MADVWRDWLTGQSRNVALLWLVVQVIPQSFALELKKNRYSWSAIFACS